MGVLFDASAFAMSMSLLWFGSGLAVRGLTKLSGHMHVSQFIISFVIFGFASTFPEFFIGVTSALDGVPQLGLGTLLGSNLLDLTVILGAVAIVGRKINIVHKVVRLDIWYVLLASLPVLLILDRSLGRVDAIILLLAFFIYVWNMWKESKQFAKVKISSTVGDLFAALGLFVLGILVLFFSSSLVVKYAEIIALDLGLQQSFIGLVLVAFSTTLPEFSFAIKALRENKSEMAIGDIFGNVIIDATFVAAIVALIHPITIPNSSILVGGTFMVFASMLALFFIEAEKQLTWKSGLLMFFLYYVFLSTEVGINFLSFG